MVNIIRKLKNSEYGMRIQEKFYPSKRNDPATTLHFTQSMDRFHACDDKKNASRIKKEIQICKKFWNCYPYHYYMYDLYRNDKQLTNKELINYIPHFFFNYLFLPYYSSPQFSMIADNKIMTEYILSALKINKPKTLCILFDQKLFSPDMLSYSYEDVRKQLCENTHEKIFVKPAEGYGGKGIYIFHKTEGGQYVTRQNIFFNEKFLRMIGKNNNYIIQFGIIQDPEISKIYPQSVNTCRIITENKEGIIRIVCAMLRIGRNQNEIDNISSGGICTSININSGKFGDFAISYNSEKFTKTPDTQFELLNQGISRWSEIKSYTLASAGKLPFFTYLGWDMALTPTYPMVVEINSSPAIDIIEKTSSGLREAFGIDNPDYYWKNSGKKYEI